MQTYSETIFGFPIVFYCDPNFGIGDSVAGTTPVALIEQTLTFYRGFHLPTLTDELVFHQICWYMFMLFYCLSPLFLYLMILLFHLSLYYFIE